MLGDGASAGRLAADTEAGELLLMADLSSPGNMVGSTLTAEEQLFIPEL